MNAAITLSDSLQYHLVYDAGTAGFTDWWFLALAVLVLGAMGISAHRSLRGDAPARERYFYLFAIPFVTVCLLIAARATFGQGRELRDALAAGQYTVVEGTVQDFSPSDRGDHTEERWRVESNGTMYMYHYVRSRPKPGFRQTAVHGGPIRPGLHVRIADVDGYIARLEVSP